MNEHRLPSPVFLLGFAAVFAAWSMGLDLSGAGATIAACSAIAIFGLPHGSFDLQLIQRESGSGYGLTRIAILYIGCGAAMLMLWLLDPLPALSIFLVIAVAHFAEDWEDTGSPFLNIGLSAAILSSSALLHRVELAVIFDAMTDGRGAVLVDGLLLIAPISLAVGLVAVGVLIQIGRPDLGVGALGALVAMVLLPPAVGFALFFCLLHSPRHFAAGVRRLALPRAAQWMPIVLPVTLLAAAFGVIVYLIQGLNSPPTAIVSATFILLSLLTVPHMTVPMLVRLRPQRRSRLVGISARS